MVVSYLIELFISTVVLWFGILVFWSVLVIVLEKL
jgi:hypothetical protein